MKINNAGLGGMKLLLIASALLFALPALANETPSSTPDVNNSTSTPEVVVPTSTIPVETPSSTPTSTPEVTEPVLATTTINLSIITSAESFVFPNLLVTACPEVDSSTVFTLNAMCALQQSGLTIEWSTFGTDMFLNAIEPYTNNWADGKVWNWFSDLNYGMTALNKHLLTDSEDLLLTYDQFPLKININSSTPETGTTTTIIVEQFGFEGFAPVWNPAASSTVSINNTLVSNDAGTYSLFITSTDPIGIFGTKPGFIPSAVTYIYPTTTFSSATTTENNTSTPSGGGGSGSGNSNQFVSQELINQTVEKLLAFIKSKQETDGKIIDGATSDWLAMSFAANNTYAADIKNGTAALYDYIYNYPIAELDNELNNCTAYPRHILALLASGVSKTDTKVGSLKTKMDACVENNNFGANGINDDAFGLLAAVATGYDQNSAVVQTTLAALLANQQPDGGFAYPGPFESPDLTGVALNALKYAQNNGLAVDSAIFTKGKAYLKAQQLADGGWGFGASDALTTSWTVMGINALGENQGNWFTSAGKNPWHVLTTLDNDHYTQVWDGNIDWFATKHAVPALLGKSWPLILTPVSQPVSGGTGGGTNTSIPTTTISTSKEVISIIPTTTEAIATSTPTTTTVEIITITEPEEDIYGEILGIQITNQANETTIEELLGKEQPATEPEITATKTISTDTPQDTTSTQNLEKNSQPASSQRNWAIKILLISLAGIAAIGLFIGAKALQKKN